ncbi:MAG: hypothetical protein LAO22_14790 [Acidobacteriia bacterium]|nr:hypothetical protein [Terriglobia bacterium]
MFRSIVCLTIFLVLIGWALSAQAQELASSGAAATAQAVANPDAPASCPHLFTAGSSTSNTFLQYCVTDVGAISSIQTPFGQSLIGANGEGYGLCQESPAVEYHDYIFDWSNNWDFPQTLSLSSSSIKISRTTSDGNWTLVQTISKVAATGSIKIVMALTNNQSVDKVAYLVRFADVDAEGNNTSAGGASLDSAWSWQTAFPNKAHYGLQLRNAGSSPFAYRQGFIRGAPWGPNACDFAANRINYGVIGNSRTKTSIAYAYAGAVPAHKTVTVTLNYRAT